MTVPSNVFLPLCFFWSKCFSFNVKIFTTHLTNQKWRPSTQFSVTSHRRNYLEYSLPVGSHSSYLLSLRQFGRECCLLAVLTHLNGLSTSVRLRVMSSHRPRSPRRSKSIFPNRRAAIPPFDLLPLACYISMLPPMPHPFARVRVRVLLCRWLRRHFLTSHSNHYNTLFWLLDSFFAIV